MATFAMVSWPNRSPLGTSNPLFYAAALSYLFFAVPGIPTILFLRRFERTTLPWFALGGALSGVLGGLAVVVLLVAISGVSGTSLRSIAETIGYGVLAGTLVYASYWAMQRTA